MSQVAQVLRLDRDTWRWLDSDASLRGAGFMVLGAYLLLAFARFGWPDFAVRATTQMLLIGFYGWMGLAVASWIAVRSITRSPSELPDYIRLTGRAHFPLLIVAMVLLVFPVTLNVSGVARWPALFAGLFWMPAMLVNAVASPAELRLRRAALPALVPYAVWVAVVGRWLWRQVGHLL